MAGAIYGTILVAGVLAASSDAGADVAGHRGLRLRDRPGLLAAAWADSLARRVTATRRGLEAFASRWPTSGRWCSRPYRRLG